MSQGKFAPVTAALLARKGEARPWNRDGTEITPQASGGFFTSPVASRTPVQEEHANDAMPHPIALTFPQTGDGTRRLTLKVSQSDYERLALIAAKRDVTRQRLLQQMLHDFL